VSLRSYFAPLRRWWSLILIATVVAGASGLLLASTIPPTYEARTEVLVGPVNGDVDTIRAAGLLVQTIAELSVSDQVLSGAAAAAGASADPATLRNDVRTTGDNVTRIVTIRVDADQPQRAAALAGGIADRLAALSAADAGRPEGQLQVIHAAEADPEPVAPRPLLLVTLAALAGLLGSLALVVILEQLSRAVRSPEDVAEITPVPVLASLPAPRRGQSTSLVVETDPSSTAAAGYRLLASRLDLDRFPDGPTRLHIAGVGARTSSGVIAANLAATIVANGIPVAVLDGDPAGHASAVITRAISDPNLDASTIARIRLIVADLEDGDEDAPETPLASLGRIGDERRHTLVVSGPVNYDRLDIGWAIACDRTLLVIERDRTHRNDAALALERLQRAGVHVAGIVLASAPRTPELRRLPSRRL